MSLVGGVRQNIRNYDFKYTFDKSRKNWIQSGFPHVASLVNIVANIPYDRYVYHGDIVYSFEGLPNEVPKDFDIENHDPHPIIRNDTFSVKGNNSLGYRFFGGICFELLNDAYPNTNLYDFVDPTSDIDIVVLARIPDQRESSKTYKQLSNDYIKTNQFSEIDTTKHLVVKPSLEEPNLEPYLNPYFRDMSDFIFEEMLTQLNLLNLNVIHSVPFDIDDEYPTIVDSVKNDELGYRIENILNSNAKLIRYVDSDLKTLRIQIVLKIVVDGEEITDHLLEFLITVTSVDNYDFHHKTLKLTIPESQRQINIDKINQLISDNLSAYKVREEEVYDEGARRHKPINHITRFIYLLDLLKNNDNLISDQSLILFALNKYILPSYIYYKVINNNFSLDSINTIDIICAFYTVFRSMCANFEKSKIYNLINKTITPDEEKQCYNSLMTLFKMNASPFRKNISKQLTLSQQKKKKKESRMLDEINEHKRMIKNTYKLDDDPNPFSWEDSSNSSDKNRAYDNVAKNKKTYRKQKRKTQKRNKKRTRRVRRNFRK